VWGTASFGDNVVWGTASAGDNVVWGTSVKDDGDLTWASNSDEEVMYADDATEPLTIESPPTIPVIGPVDSLLTIPVVGPVSIGGI
jgi:hypothetical protein